MYYQIIVVDECGDDVVASKIESNVINTLGKIELEVYLETLVNRYREAYPEARSVYAECVKTWGEQIADEYQERIKELVAWAENNPDELDGYDPYDWAIETADDEFSNSGWDF